MGNMLAARGDVSPETAATETELEKMSSKTTALVDRPLRCAKAVMSVHLRGWTLPYTHELTGYFGN